MRGFDFEDAEDRRQFIEDYFNGRIRVGEVSLWHFDLGVAETMGAVRLQAPNGTQQFYLTNVPGVATAPGHPGVPVVFEISDDMFRSNKLPAVVIRRTGMLYAMERWHPGAQQYRVPARNAVPVIVNGVQGYSHYEERQQAIPHNLEYTISLLCRNRGGEDGGAINEAQHLLKYVWRFYQPYCTVYVRDSDSPPDERCFRGYTAFLEDTQPESQVIEVTGRIIGFSLRLRVEAQIDVNPAEVKPAVTQPPIITVDHFDES